ncbi:hypothetical protein GCM10017562_01250 [Streptomyces roseofulvus]|uniref:hypothetical protein n=1 Tax=Streptomyces roseofulvus TaxID=33902 RepID=UPI0031FA21C9
MSIHCEVWAGTLSAPYTWLLRQDEALVPVVAVRRLRAAAWWLAERLDDDPDDPRLSPSAALRLWLGDGIGHEEGSRQLATELADRLTAGAYLTEVGAVIGPDRVRCTLTAMPAAGCVCGTGAAAARTAAETATEPLAAAGGWSR